MKRLLMLFAFTILLSCGCAALQEWITGGTSDLDNSRRFWDQTSDNPRR